MVDSSLLVSLGSAHSLSIRFGSRCKNLCKGSPWFQVYLGSPTALTNWRSPLFSGTVLSLSGLTVVVLGLVPLSLLWSGSSPSIDAKEVPRLNDFWLYRLLEGSRHPPGRLLTVKH